jgi:hypothetical protein
MVENLPSKCMQDPWFRLQYCREKFRKNNCHWIIISLKSF